MSSQNFSRVPVRFLSSNDDLIKGDAGQSHGSTDYSQDVTVATVRPGVQADYRTPPDRACGLEIFRRYMDGKLDIEYACHKVIDAMHSVKDKSPLNEEQESILSVLFPQSFSFLDAGVHEMVAMVKLKITPDEQATIRMCVAAHFAEEMNWNGGLGGGSTPGRSQTRS